MVDVTWNVRWIQEEDYELYLVILNNDEKEHHKMELVYRSSKLWSVTCPVDSNCTITFQYIVRSKEKQIYNTEIRVVNIYNEYRVIVDDSTMSKTGELKSHLENEHQLRLLFGEGSMDER